LGGDFNARTAELGNITWREDEEEQARKESKDKITNRQGRKLIEWTEEMGLGIMNGNIRR